MRIYRSLAVATVTLVVACGDVLEPTAVRSSASGHHPGATAQYSAAGSVVDCPFGPASLVKRVAAGTDDDANGNGIVCAMDDGLPGMPPIATADDNLLGPEVTP